MTAAFEQLRRFARGHQQRLSEVARQLVAGELDPAQLVTTALSRTRPDQS